LSLVLAELIARVWKGVGLDFTTNFLAEELDLLHKRVEYTHDPELGWVLLPKFQGPMFGSNGGSLTVLASGFRSNGRQGFPDSRLGPRILAVGDSFTYGADVGDNETWPANLEALSQTTVWNAGVGGYGLDQSILRAMSLVPRYKPDLVIVGLFTADVERCQMSFFSGAAKPYFAVSQGQLVLKNTPVPMPTRSVKNPSLLRRVLGHSYLLHKFLMRLAPEIWSGRAWYRSESDAPPVKIGCLLMRRLAALSSERKMPVVILGIYNPSRLGDKTELASRQVLDCARAEGLAVLDLLPALRQLQSTDPARLDSLSLDRMTGGKLGHLTPAGNRFVAEQLHGFLKTNPDLLGSRNSIEPGPPNG
jgi:hypothetical protein